MTSIPSSLAPSVEDDLETELLPLRRRRRLPVATTALAVAAVAAGAFVGGVEIQKHYGATPAVAARGTGAGAAAAARFDRFAAAGAAGGFTTGQVSVVKGSTLYVTSGDGNTVKVSTAGARVTKTVTASAKAIAPGDTVGVVGTAGADGTILARTISVGGAAGRFGGGFGGGAGGASGFAGGGATGFGGGSR